VKYFLFLKIDFISIGVRNRITVIENGTTETIPTVYKKTKEP